MHLLWGTFLVKGRGERGRGTVISLFWSDLTSRSAPTLVELGADVDLASVCLATSERAT